MSAQTGAMPPSGPASRRLVDRARFRFERLEGEPNPLWLRELKQSARLGRTPVVLMVISIVMTLLMASIGGGLSRSVSPASIGIALFHTFFSIAFFVVTWIGPAVAANSIASEREGRTWEAVILTGLRPEIVARGKFLAAYTSVGMYIVMLAPVGAMSFLFGGVTAIEVVTAFLFLFLVALLSVAFGLAISAKMASTRVAIVLTLLLSVPISIIAYLSLGLGLSYAVHDVWPMVPEGPPVWLPAAYDRVPFSVEYFVFLVVLPAVLIALPAWFLYEVTVANLATASDDRSTGLKRWFLASTPVMTLAAALPALAVPSDPDAAAVFGTSGMVCYLLFCAFVFQGEPVGASRRVQAQWAQSGAGKWTRFLGPGLITTAVTQLVVGSFGFVLIMAIGTVAIEALGALDRTEQHARNLLFGAYALGFFMFTVGFGAYTRAKTTSPGYARMVLLVVVGCISVLPWVAAAVVGAIGDFRDDEMLIAAPSPFYAIRMLVAVGKAGDDAVILTGMACATLWGAAGVVLLGVARRRAKAVISDYEAKWAEADQRFREEDEGVAQAEPPPGPPSQPPAAEVAPWQHGAPPPDTPEGSSPAETADVAAPAEPSEEQAPNTHRSGGGEPKP